MFSRTQQNYSTIERELAAIRWGVENFKCFVYGVQFLLYTDHKPLIYMNTMAAHSSRVHRTLQELSEYDFKIRYLPGIENDAADALSRMSPKTIQEEQHQEGIPPEFRIERVDGGGNSMFLSLMAAIETILDETQRSTLPSNHLQMRREVISELLQYPEKYKIPNNKYEKRKLKTMLNNDQLPCTHALLAASKLYQLEIRVYHNIKTPVIFKATKDLSFKIINLQCISYIHFNPIFAFRPVKQEINERMINTITKESDTVTQETVDEELNIACLYEVHDDEKVCSHASFNMSTITKCNGQVMCALLDTGAQVSLICESSWKKARKDDTRHFDLKAPLRGISGSNSSCLGVVELGIAFEDGQDLPPFPFAFVEDNLLPCCMFDWTEFPRIF